MGPWTVSIVFHVLLVAIGLMVTWSILHEDDRLPSPLVTSDIVAMTPLVPLRESPLMEHTAVAPSMPPPPTLATAAPQLPVSAPALSSSLPATGESSVRFAGAPLGAARDVVFVLDATGSMIAWLPFVIDEVERTLASMHPDQRFAVRYFAGDAVQATPPRQLTAVTASAADRAVKTLRRDAGRRMKMQRGSDPTKALEDAIRLQPDLILLMSEGLAGRGQWEVDRSAVMKALDVANPVRSVTGMRDVRIECIRLVSGDEEPAAPLMELIAESHGGGAMRIVTLEDLD